MKKRYVLGVSGVVFAVSILCLIFPWCFSISPSWHDWLSLLPGIILLLNGIYFFVSFPLRPLSIKSIQRSALDRNKSFPRWYPFALLMRMYLFPFFLTIYLLYLLIDQTSIWNLHISGLFLALNESLLLVLTIISGIGMLFGEQYDERVVRKSDSLGASRLFFVLVCCLSIAGGYIVLQQVTSLESLGVIIANIVLLLLFFVGLLLFDEEDNAQE